MAATAKTTTLLVKVPKASSRQTDLRIRLPSESGSPSMLPRPALGLDIDLDLAAAYEAVRTPTPHPLSPGKRIGDGLRDVNAIYMERVRLHNRLGARRIGVMITFSDNTTFKMVLDNGSFMVTWMDGAGRMNLNAVFNACLWSIPKLAFEIPYYLFNEDRHSVLIPGTNVEISIVESDLLIKYLDLDCYDKPQSIPYWEPFEPVPLPIPVMAEGFEADRIANTFGTVASIKRLKNTPLADHIFRIVWKYYTSQLFMQMHIATLYCDDKSSAPKFIANRCRQDFNKAARIMRELAKVMGMFVPYPANQTILESFEVVDACSVRPKPRARRGAGSGGGGGGGGTTTLQDVVDEIEHKVAPTTMLGKRKAKKQ